MAGQSEKTSDCHICKKTAKQRIKEKDTMNYYYTERTNGSVIYRGKCRDCYYGGTNGENERTVA